MPLFGQKDVHRFRDALREIFISIDYYNPDGSRNPPIAAPEKVESEVAAAVAAGQRLAAKGKTDSARQCLEVASRWQLNKHKKVYFTGGSGVSFEEAASAAKEAARTSPDDPLWAVRDERWRSILAKVAEDCGVAS